MGERHRRDSSRPLDSAAELPALRRVVERDPAVVGADGYCFWFGCQATQLTASSLRFRTRSWAGLGIAAVLAAWGSLFVVRF